MTRRDIRPVLTVPILLLGLAACSGDGPTSPDDRSPPSAGETVLLSVAPEGGSTGVGVDTVITVDFSHPVGPSMSEYAVVHEGEIAGPEAPGAWEWLDDDMMMGRGMGGGMDPSRHMGGNWDHPTNGSHGMIFTFTTAG